MDREPYYYVNKEKGIVVCELTGCTIDAVTLMAKHFTPLQEIGNTIKGCTSCSEASCKALQDIPNNFLMRNSYKAIAKVQDGDTYDEEKGKAIAYRKALVKYNIALVKKVRFIANDHDKYSAKRKEELDLVKKIAKKRLDRSVVSLTTSLKEVK